MTIELNEHLSKLECNAGLCVMCNIVWLIEGLLEIAGLKHNMHGCVELICFLVDELYFRLCQHVIVICRDIKLVAAKDEHPNDKSNCLKSSYLPFVHQLLLLFRDSVAAISGLPMLQLPLLIIMYLHYCEV